MKPFSRCVVVTPTFNSERFLDETIASVVLQAAPDVAIDYHIQDGGSTDGTEAIVRAWIERIEHGAVPRLARSVRLSYASARDRGMYDALNAGMAALAPGSQDMVTWINSDDRLAPGALATVQRIFTDHSGCEWLSGRSAALNEAGSVISITYPRSFSRDAVSSGRHDGRELLPIMQEGTFFTGRVWSAVGGLDATFRLAGDWDLWRRMAREVPHFSVDTLTAFHRHRSGQLSADMESYYGEVDARPTERSDRATPNIPSQLIRFDDETGRWAAIPFGPGGSRPPIALVDGHRRPTCAVTHLEGFGPPEGPYPEFQLPAGIRWMRKTSAEVAVEAPHDGTYRMALTLRTTLAGLTLRLYVNGIQLTEAALASPMPDTDQIVAVTVWLGVGRNVAELEVAGGPGEARLLMLVGCTVVAEADGGREAPREPVVPVGELLRAINGNAVVVTARDDATRLVATLASVRDAAGPALFVRVKPGTDLAAAAAALVPYAGWMVEGGGNADEQLRTAGYRSVLEIAEGHRLRAETLPNAHRLLLEHNAAVLTGLTDVEDAGRTLVRTLLSAALQPVLRDLSGEGRGEAHVALRLATCDGEAASPGRTAAPRVCVVDARDGWHPARPLLALAGALRMLGVDARYTLGGEPSAGELVIAAAEVSLAVTADYVSAEVPGGLRLEAIRGGRPITLPRALDAEAFRPRAARRARAALGLSADCFLVLADEGQVEETVRAAPPAAQLAKLGGASAPEVVTLPRFTDPDTLAHVVSAFDAVVAPRGAALALVAAACGVPTLDSTGTFVTVEGAGGDGPGLGVALRRLVRGRAALRGQAAEVREAVERTGTLQALALALLRQAAALPGLHDWLSSRDHLAVGAIALPTDAPIALEPLQAPQHRGFALQPLAGVSEESDPIWSTVLRLDAAEVTLLLRIEDITGTALRLHLTGPKAGGWSIEVGDEDAASVFFGEQPVTTVRIEVPLPPGLHRVVMRALHPVGNAAFAVSSIVAWEVVSARPLPSTAAQRTRLVPAPFAGRPMTVLERDGDWRPGEGFLHPESPHPQAGLWSSFLWTRAEGAAFRLRIERGGERTIDLALSGGIAGQRMRLVIGAYATPWTEPLLAYVGRVSHARWNVDWAAGDVDVAIELADGSAGNNPRNLGVLVLGLSLS